MLTIIIPTYNRAIYLERLLAVLEVELVNLSKLVKVIVSNNASTDETADICKIYEKRNLSWQFIHHKKNIGPDKNFCFCVERVDTKYFWIIGDDDLPRQGLIEKIISLIQEKKPKILYIQSKWTNPITKFDQKKPINDLNFTNYDAYSFAKTVHVWFTFISAIVVDKESLNKVLECYTLDRFDGTYFIQLGWVFPLLKTNGPFIFVKNEGILATSGNSGGYEVLKVFCINFPKIVKESFELHPLISKIILKQFTLEYLPGLVWGVRFSKIGSFESENFKKLKPKINEQLGNNLLYWLFVYPLITYPKLFAFPFYILLKLVTKLVLIIKCLFKFEA